ncbi:myosin-11-like [Dorcoceras hygrometricum]|uniref:Myosin-11-like n=1 Tax=Dorcoceras hygrometricum TaxID=472368 RepID=A0A2Z7AP83_9LAMI|nr:myosin-11-like [Dorcoceras hygrometricum]
MASGLSGFLGCPAVLYEDALTEFFLNGSIRDGKVVNTIRVKRVEISEELFASTFELPVDGLKDLSEIPKDIVFDARSIFYFSGEQMGKAVLLYVIEGPNRDRGAVIARPNTNIKSTCWIRTMLRINGTWVIEPCADYWQQIPRAVASSIVVIPSRLSYVHTLPPVSEFFKFLKKRWADVCIEDVAFVVSGKLLPVGSLNFYRAIAVVQTVSVFGFQRPTVTSWGWSQLCTEFFRYSLFSRLLTVDFRISGSATILIRPYLCSANIFDTGVQLPHISFYPASVVGPNVQSITSSDAANQDVQMDIDRHGDSPDSSADSSFHFNANDISTEDDAALDQSILPSSTADISASLSTLRESFSKLFANQTRDSRKSGDAHSEEAQNDNNALSRALKAVRAQNAILSTDLAATQKEVKDIKGSDDKKGEGISSRPQPPPDDKNRPSGGSGSRADDPSRYGGGTVSREGGNRGGDGRRRGDSSGSSKRRNYDSGGGSGCRINYGPYLPPNRDAEYWISRKRQF